MSIKQVRNKIMEYIINGNNADVKITQPKVSLEAYTNRNNSIELNYIPFIDVNYNKNPTINKPSVYNSKISNDNLTKVYVVGISILGLYILNSLMKKK